MENKELTNNVQNGNVQAQPQVIIAQSPKNVGLAVALGLFLGPLGLFYSSIIGGIIMLVISIPLCIFTLGIGVLFTAPVCAIWAYIAASKYNKELMSTGRIQ